MDSSIYLGNMLIVTWQRCVFFVVWGCEESLKIFDEGVPAELLGLDDLDVSKRVWRCRSNLWVFVARSGPRKT